MDKYNPTIIEMVSVNKLKDALLRTEQVEPDIRENDKTPSWDGELRVYKSKQFNKSNLWGKIPVQVKGKLTHKFRKSSHKLSVKISDIQNYLKDEGVLFFAVLIKDFNEYQIYYRILLPFDLRRILTNSTGQLTKQITLQVFPHNSVEGILKILAEFVQNKKKQGTLLPNVTSLSDLKDTNIDIERFEFSIPAVGINPLDNPLESFLNSEPYLYIKPRNLDASFVVDKIQLEKVSYNKGEAVLIDGKILYEDFSIIRMAGQKTKIKISKGIEIYLEPTSPKIQFKFIGSLREQILQMKFLIALAQKRNVQVGSISFQDSQPDLGSHSVDEFIKHLDWLQRVQQTLDKLHVTKDLLLDELSSQSLKQLEYLVTGIMLNKPVPLSCGGIAGYLELANLKLLLMCKPSHEDALYYISDFFETRNSYIHDDNSDPIPISPYLILTKDFFTSYDNMSFKQMAPSICSYPLCEMYRNRIIAFVLELLHFYDSDNQSDNIILNIAEELNLFVQKDCLENTDVDIINLLQIKKRKRALTSEENKILLTLKSAEKPFMFQLAANILLESFHEAELIFDKLDKCEKEEFLSYPIYHLWRRD